MDPDDVRTVASKKLRVEKDLQNYIQLQRKITAQDYANKKKKQSPMGPRRVAIINAKFQIRQHRYQPNLIFDFGGYDYWR